MPEKYDFEKLVNIFERKKFYLPDGSEYIPEVGRTVSYTYEGPNLLEIVIIRMLNISINPAAYKDKIKLLQS